MNEIIEALKMVKRMQKDMELVKVLDTVISLLQKKEEQDEATRAAFVESLRALNAPERIHE